MQAYASAQHPHLQNLARSAGLDAARDRAAVIVVVVLVLVLVVLVVAVVMLAMLVCGALSTTTTPARVSTM